MTVWLDIVYSTILGGVIILIIMNANIIIGQTWANYNSDIAIQQILLASAAILENDLSNIGAGMQIAQNSILEATDTSITFQMIKGVTRGLPTHTIRYHVGSVDELAHTENPKDRYLYRFDDREDTSPVPIGRVTKFELEYFDILNDTVPKNGNRVVDINDLRTIRNIQITMEVQNPSPSSLGFEGEQHYFATILWRQNRLTAKNLTR